MYNYAIQGKFYYENVNINDINNNNAELTQFVINGINAIKKGD